MYPYNYYFCIWTAEKAYYTSFEVDNKEALRRLNIAQRWCNAGLGLNAYNSQLRRLKTHLLEKKSPSEAADYWKKYVEWQFWEPYNHAVLAELYAETGDFDKAFRGNPDDIDKSGDNLIRLYRSFSKMCLSNPHISIYDPIRFIRSYAPDDKEFRKSIIRNILQRRWRAKLRLFKWRITLRLRGSSYARTMYGSS